MKGTKKKLIIVAKLEKKPAPEVIEKPIQKKKYKKIWQIEEAKSSRSMCSTCKKVIVKGELRVGVVTFYPHRNCKWNHYECSERNMLGATEETIWGKSALTEEQRAHLLKKVLLANAITVPAKMPTIVGELDMNRFANIMTGRYNRFRGFTFGLPDKEKYGKNWNWRCFLATMLVCNTHETAMLKVTDKLFLVYKDPKSLATLEDDKTTQKAWLQWMEKNDMRHAGKKMNFILKANRNLIDNYNEEVPNDRDELQAMSGVGRHVASVTMAWVHEEAEFGIDTHVKRIMERWGYVNKKDTDVEIEEKVKKIIPHKQIGAFSRAFVDHGQQVCGYTPDCENCYLKHSCPTAAKYLDW